LLVLVAVVVFLIWWSRNPIVFVSNQDAVKLQARRLTDKEAETAIDLELSLTGSGDGYFLSTIEIPRQVAEAAGIQPPAGFHEQSMPLEQPQDTEDAEFVKKWNAENVRFVGRLDLKPGQRCLVSIPARDPRLVTGTLNLTYEWRGRYVGGSVRSAKVDLNPSSTADDLSTP